MERQKNPQDHDLITQKTINIIFSPVLLLVKHLENTFQVYAHSTSNISLTKPTTNRQNQRKSHNLTSQKKTSGRFPPWQRQSPVTIVNRGFAYRSVFVMGMGMRGIQGATKIQYIWFRILIDDRGPCSCFLIVRNRKWKQSSECGLMGFLFWRRV